jgi:hypothetical protein
MVKKKVNENLNVNLNSSEKAVNPWDIAISDAERKIQEARARIRKLRGSILVFKDMRDSREPFPGEKSEHTNP